MTLLWRGLIYSTSAIAMVEYNVRASGVLQCLVSEH